MARSLALKRLVGGLSARAYFVVVTRDIPSLRAMEAELEPPVVSAVDLIGQYDLQEGLGTATGLLDITTSHTTTRGAAGSNWVFKKGVSGGGVSPFPDPLPIAWADPHRPLAIWRTCPGLFQSHHAPVSDRSLPVVTT